MAEAQRKVLALSPAARARFGSGRVYNMVVSDTQTLQDFCMVGGEKGLDPQVCVCV
jgi:hypothetical protein